MGEAGSPSFATFSKSLHLAQIASASARRKNFFIEDQNDLVDIPSSEVVVGKVPIPPEGYEIARIDVVMRLRRKRG